MQPATTSRGFNAAFPYHSPKQIAAARSAAARLVREITRQPASVVEAFLDSEEGWLLGRDVAEYLALGLQVDGAVMLNVREWDARQIAHGKYSGCSYLRVHVGQFAPPKKLGERYRLAKRRIVETWTEQGTLTLVTINDIAEFFALSRSRVRRLLRELQLAPDTTAVRQSQRGRTARVWRLGRVARAFHRHYSTLVERADANDPVRGRW